MKIDKCRICSSSKKNFVEILNFSKVALSGSFLKENQIKNEIKYPLNLVFCKKCKHPQIGFYLNKDLLFKNYLWETGISTQNIKLIKSFIKKIKNKINQNTKVIEIASNDGSLLKILKDQSNCKVLGVDPARNFKQKLKKLKINNIDDYFSYKLSKKIKLEYDNFDICIARNVIAHLKNPNDIFKGVKNILSEKGIFIIEVPHLLNIYKDLQFDNIFHEHVGFHSLKSISDLSKTNKLYLYDVEKVDSQGGSIRCYISNKKIKPSKRLNSLIEKEKISKLYNLNSWIGFSNKVKSNNLKLKKILTNLKNNNKKISVYGASGKGQTLLQYLNFDKNFFDNIYDKSSAKQGLYSPGTHIKIIDPNNILNLKPDYILLCSWNILKEIKEQQKKFLKKGGKFIIPFPTPKIIS